jgi:hypothetical protein
MRVTALNAAILATTALVCVSAMAAPARAAAHKVTCLCDCPDDHKLLKKTGRVETRKFVRRAARIPTVREGYAYNYAAAAPVMMGGWHGAWRVAPNDGQVAMIQAYREMPPAYGPPMAYGPPPRAAYYGPAPDGMPIDDRGFSGGVGYMADGGGGGGGSGFADGFGQVHFAQGGNTENGPTYNSYGQSFQSNPSMAGPFQARLMGGFAPPPSK